MTSREDIFVAAQSFCFEDKNGIPQVVKQGATVRHGHPILKGHEDMFRPLVVDYDTQK